MNRVFAFADWTIGPERDDEGHVQPLVREVQCQDCEETSEPDTALTKTDLWAMRHTGLTGHRSFREVTTARLTVQPAPTNPLYEQEGKAP